MKDVKNRIKNQLSQNGVVPLFLMKSNEEDVLLGILNHAMTDELAEINAEIRKL